MNQVLSALPGWAKAPLRQVRKGARLIRCYGTGRLCPVCGATARRFCSYGAPPSRQDGECVRCGALERHRLLWLYLTRCTDLFDGRKKRVLHVAPESCLEPRFRDRLGEGYLTADLTSERAALKMDVTHIRFPDDSFDVIYCSHVLEHVPDDRRAMRESHRVLKKDGWAILLAPITAETTYEDPSIVTPEERRKAFGQMDHVRRYGWDYPDRLREAGFHVEMTRVQDLADPEEAVQMGLTPASGEIYFCRKSP